MEVFDGYIELVEDDSTLFRELQLLYHLPQCKPSHQTFSGTWDATLLRRGAYVVAGLQLKIQKGMPSAELR